MAGRNVLITGIAGFIGFHLSKRLIVQGDSVTGIDNVNDYYDVNLKMARLLELESSGKFKFIKADIADQAIMEEVFSGETFDVVFNLAAQAGVRYSLVNPYSYVLSNVVGFLNVLEGCKKQKVGHLVYASSSSVYGANKELPFSVKHNVDHPISMYAATKKSNELMAHTYSSLYNLPTTGLRFFTVYGPWGRPDMALFLFTDAILKGKPIDVYNYGNMRRDFTYIDDIIEGIVRVADKIPQPDPRWDGSTSASFAPYRLYNIGNNVPVELMHFINAIETALGKKAIKNMMPLQAGDVKETFADVDDLIASTGFKPSTTVEEGVKRFIDWYTGYYGTGNMG